MQLQGVLTKPYLSLQKPDKQYDEYLLNSTLAAMYLAEAIVWKFLCLSL